MWGQMAAAWEGRPLQEVGTERWLRGMARRRQAGGWGKHLRPSQGRKKKKNHLISTPHPTTAKKLMSWEQVAEVPHL